MTHATPDQEKVITTAQRLARELGRRPNANDLWSTGVAFGRRQPFSTLQALHEAAGLALPGPQGLAGLTPAEEGVFLRLWEEGKTRREMGDALGLSPHVISAEVVARALVRETVFKPTKAKAERDTLRRRCPDCLGGVIGEGPCPHCLERGRPNAA